MSQPAIYRFTTSADEGKICEMVEHSTECGHRIPFEDLERGVRVNLGRLKEVSDPFAVRLCLLELAVAHRMVSLNVENVALIGLRAEIEPHIQGLPQDIAEQADAHTREAPVIFLDTDLSDFEEVDTATQVVQTPLGVDRR